MDTLKNKVNEVNESLLVEDRDMWRGFCKLYKDSYQSAVKELEATEQRVIQLTAQLAANRQQFINLLRLLREKYGLTSNELGQDVVYGSTFGKPSGRRINADDIISVDFDNKDIDVLINDGIS